MTDETKQKWILSSIVISLIIWSIYGYWHLPANVPRGDRLLVNAIIFVGLPVSIFLSYAEQAAEDNSAYTIRFEKWRGMAFYVWAVGASVAINMTGFYAVEAVTTPANRPGIGVGYALFGLAAVVWLLGVGYLAIAEKAPWLWIKGSAILIHGWTTRHPADSAVPSDPTVPIDRAAFKDGVDPSRYTARRGLRAWLTPSFLHNHEAEAAKHTKDRIEENTAILKASVERERARAELADRKKHD